jgi:hypothetical protein
VTAFLARETRGTEYLREDPFWSIYGYHLQYYAVYVKICIGLALSKISKQRSHSSKRLQRMSEVMQGYIRSDSGNVQILLAYFDFTYGPTSSAGVLKYLANRSRGGLSLHEKQKRTHPGFDAAPLLEVLKICIWDYDRGFVQVSVSETIFNVLNQIDPGNWAADEIMHALLEITTYYGDRFKGTGFNGPLLLPDGNIHINRMSSYYDMMLFKRIRTVLSNGVVRWYGWNPEGIVDKFFYGMILREARPELFVGLYSTVESLIFFPSRDPEGLGVLADCDRYKVDCMKAIKKTRCFSDMIHLFTPICVTTWLWDRSWRVPEDLLYRICDWRDMLWLLPDKDDDLMDRKLAITNMLICIFLFDAADILRQMGPVVLGALFSSDRGCIQLLWRLYPEYCTSVGVSDPGPFEVETGEVFLLGPPERCVKYVQEVSPALVRGKKRLFDA